MPGSEDSVVLASASSKSKSTVVVVEDERHEVEMDMDMDMDSLLGQAEDEDELDGGLEDPWDTAFPPKKSTGSKSKLSTSENDKGTGLRSSSSSRPPELLPKMDESGLFTKIAKKEWMCNECSRYEISTIYELYLLQDACGTISKFVYVRGMHNE